MCSLAYYYTKSQLPLLVLEMRPDSEKREASSKCFAVELSSDSEVSEEKDKCVYKTVGDNRDPQIPASAQIGKSQDKPNDRGTK